MDGISSICALSSSVSGCLSWISTPSIPTSASGGGLFRRGYPEENRWRCSFRSDGKWINVNELLQVFGGGGHAAAAGVRKRTNDVEKFRQEILERIIMMRKISGQNKELETKHRRTRRCRMMEKESQTSHFPHLLQPLQVIRIPQFWHCSPKYGI